MARSSIRYPTIPLLVAALGLMGAILVSCSVVVTPQPPQPPISSTPPPASSYQPGFPVRAAFFYDWFPDAWRQQGVFPYSNYTSVLGEYSSTDDTVVDEQISLATRSHLDALIASWWGQGDKTDLALQHILDRAARPDSPNPDLRFAVYYEPEGQGDPTAAQIVSDLEYLRQTVFSSPSYLRVNGKPVVFVYADAKDGAGMAERWAAAKAQLGGGVYTVLKVFPGYKAVADQPDSWHQYAPAQAYDSQLPYSVSVSPGFWKKGEDPRLVRDADRFSRDVSRMVSSGAQWQLVTTWNEAGEGTGVEPTASFGYSYLEVLCYQFGGGSDCETLAAASGAVTTPTTSRARATLTPAPTTAPAATPTPPSASAAGPAQPTAATTAPGSAAASTTPAALPAIEAAPDGSVTIAAVGDISCGADSGGAQCRQGDVAALLEKLSPQVVLTLGDTQYEKGTYEDFVDYFDRYFGSLKSRIMPVVGNHEYRTHAASGYFDYFDGIGQATGVAGDRDKGYYSYQLGSWWVYALNSNCSKAGGCGPGSPQETWLRAQLAAHPSRCSLMYMHHPLWSSDKREFELTELQPLYQAFYDAGGELSLVGHSHFYERYAPQTPSGQPDPTTGIREIIVGTGGRNVYGFGPIKANSEVRNGKTFGVLKVVLGPDSYQWTFVPIDGQTFTDSGTQACH